MGLALLVKFALAHISVTVCSYIKHKKHEGMSQTQAVAEINSLSSKSLESSVSVYPTMAEPLDAELLKD